MISELQFQQELIGIIENGIREDIGPGDYSSLACIPADAKGKAKLPPRVLRPRNLLQQE